MGLFISQWSNDMVKPHFMCHILFNSSVPLAGFTRMGISDFLLLFFSFFSVIESTRECLLLNKCSNMQLCIDTNVCVGLLFSFSVRNWVMLSLVNLLAILSRNSGI